jgi:rRNA biogenesis protein RRP5
MHRARVTGYFALDGYLQLSLRPSVLEKKFLQVSDVTVGEVVKGTIKKLTESALFVSLSGSVDGVVWPIHFADIPLKHPQKRFKPGSHIKCRVRDHRSLTDGVVLIFSGRFSLLIQPGHESSSRPNARW